MPQLSLIAVAVAVGALAGAGVYLKGRADGHELGRIEVLESSLDALRDRNTLDAETRTLSDAALCARLGGLWDADGQLCL